MHWDGSEWDQLTRASTGGSGASSFVTSLGDKF